MAELTVISWRAIPAQVVAREGRETARAQLPDRFQRAIDAAAMKAGLHESDAYLEEWTRTSRPCGADLETVVAAEAEALEAAFPPERLAAFVRAGGVEPE